MSFLELVHSQHGVVSRAQLFDLGLTPDAIKHRLQKGELELALPGVYRLAGSSHTGHQAIMAACLWGRGVTSHSTAAALWKLPVDEEPLVHLSVDRALRAPPGIHLHRGVLLPDDIGEAEGIPVTSVARTLLDLGSVTSEKRVADALDDAVRRRLITVAEAITAADRCKRGKRGSAAFRKAIECLDGRVINTASVFEGRLLRVLRKAGLPPPIPQYVIRDGREFVARVDFAYPQWRIVLEAQSYRYHSSPRAQQRDVYRFNRLQDLGWWPILVSWYDLDHPRPLIKRIKSRSSLSI
jgi:hypothetical protein